MSAFVGSYLAAYLRKKGENLATKEDFDALADQTSKLTQITKDIDAAVSHKVWDRQQQWEMKRDNPCFGTAPIRSHKIKSRF